MPLDENGLSIRRQPEVLADIVASEQAQIDPNINTDDDVLLGQLNQILSLAIANQEALAQAVNDNSNVLKAEGVNLDYLGANIGVRRIAGSRTTGDQLFVGSNGSTVSVGSLIDNPITLDRFEVDSSVTLSVNSCVSAKYSVKTLLDSTEYTLSVNGTPYAYTSDGTATELEILDGLKVEIDADVAATWTATVDSVELQLEIATSDEDNITISSITYISADEVSVFGTVSAVADGAIVAPANSVTQIITGGSGWDSTTNLVALTVGRSTETDEEFRARVLTSQQIAGTATVEAITDTLSNVLGVSAAVVVENDQITVDGEGRSPKSFESVVNGGTDADVAQAIWATKPAGIETYGAIAEVILDSNGNQQTINFTRPTPVILAFSVEYTKYDEESFPAGGNTTIAETVLADTVALGLGVDCIPSRYFGSIYSAVAGIDSLVVKVQQIANYGDPIVPANWQTTKLPISQTEFADVVITDITVVEV